MRGTPWHENVLKLLGSLAIAGGLVVVVRSPGNAVLGYSVAFGAFLITYSLVFISKVRREGRRAACKALLDESLIIAAVSAGTLTLKVLLYLL